MGEKRGLRVTPLKDLIKLEGVRHELARLYRHSRHRESSTSPDLMGKQLYALKAISEACKIERELEIEQRLLAIEERLAKKL